MSNGAVTDDTKLNTAKTGRKHESDTRKREAQGSVEPDKPTTPPRDSGGGGLERVTVNLVPRSSQALETAAEITSDSKTVIINRALQVYAYLEQVWKSGGDVVIKTADTEQVLKIF